MENKSLFSAIILAFTLIAGAIFYIDKTTNLEQEVKSITQEYNLKLKALQSGGIQKQTSASNSLSALESLNNQLIIAQSALKKSQAKLSLTISKTSVLTNEIMQMDNARSEVKNLRNSLKSAQKKLNISAEKISYLEGIFKSQNKATIIQNIARIKDLKKTSGSIAITGLIVPAIGVATLISYTTEEINNYCTNIKNTMSLENKIFGKIVSLDTDMQKDYHYQCEISLKDRIKEILKI